MLSKLISVSLLVGILLLIDFYVFQAVKLAFGSFSPSIQKIVFWFYWTLTFLAIAGVFYYNFGNLAVLGRFSRSYLLAPIVITYFSKLFAVLILFIDDTRRGVQWAISLFSREKEINPDGMPISRSEFLSQAAIVAAAIPMVTLGFGIVSGAHDYRIRRHKVPITGLPKAFDGLRIVQLSDIHSGSFFNKKAVKGGVEMAISERADIFVFTGDLVNNEALEVTEYIDIFKNINAPLGSFSILGNHDYGDYRSWESAEAKLQNLEDLKLAHKALGWDLLLNDARIITVDNEQLAILGCENWGAGRFQKYGNLKATYQRSGEVESKILLSHDPSHWDAQVIPSYSDVSLTLSGHTHGFQFGVEIPGFKWSPSQYIYEQWAGLYSKGQQSLYVNRGFGYIGYPGRVGILPEITVLELIST